MNGKDSENQLQALPIGWLAAHMAKRRFEKEEVIAHGKADLIDALHLPSFAHVTGKQSIIGLVHVSCVTGKKESQWDMPGFLHCRIDQVIVLDRPVRCQGQPDCWMLPNVVIEEIESQLKLE